MKRLIFILLFLFSFSKSTYATFPVNDTLITKQDTSQLETTEQYHNRMTSMGFDISLCQCNDCHKFKGPKPHNQTQKNSTRILLNIGLAIIIGILTIFLYLSFLFYSWVRSL